jgi:hypothetical protein
MKYLRARPLSRKQALPKNVFPSRSRDATSCVCQKLRIGINEELRIEIVCVCSALLRK